MTDTLSFAVAAGTLAALNPCGFAMLPAYLSLFVVGDQPGRSPALALLRALTATAAMTIGFLAVFVTFGLLLTPVASTVQRWAPALTVVLGVTLAVLGVVMMTGRNPGLRLPRLGGRSNPAAGVIPMFAYGISYAIASLGCTIGPFLVVTATTFRRGDTVTGVAAYAAYAVGMGLVVAALAVGTAVAGQGVNRWVRPVLPYLTRIGGGLLAVAGAYVAWYGLYELRVYAGADTDDPVVEAAAEVQATLARWAEQIGAGGFAIGLLVLGTISAAVTWRARLARAGHL